MPDDAHYALEKLDQAIRYLATGAGDIRARLAVAGQEILYVRESQVPIELREDFAGLVCSLTKHPPRFPSQSPLQATLHGMHRATGVRIAEQILLFRYLLWSHLQRPCLQHPPRPSGRLIGVRRRSARAYRPAHHRPRTLPASP